MTSYPEGRSPSSSYAHTPQRPGANGPTNGLPAYERATQRARYIVRCLPAPEFPAKLRHLANQYRVWLTQAVSAS
jgi:hypothetical protein